MSLPTKMQHQNGSYCLNLKLRNNSNPNGIMIGSNEASDYENPEAYEGKSGQHDQTPNKNEVTSASALSTSHSHPPSALGGIS